MCITKWRISEIMGYIVTTIQAGQKTFPTTAASRLSYMNTLKHNTEQQRTALVTDRLWLAFDINLSSMASGSPVEMSSPKTANI